MGRKDEPRLIITALPGRLQHKPIVPFYKAAAS